jgi:cytochrome c
MSGIELNKIAAAVLLASLIAMLVGFVANILYKPKLELSQRGYHLEITESNAAAGGAPEEIPVDVKTLMAKANAEAGAVIIKRCVSCHSFDNGGANKVGPNLWKVSGGPKAHRKDFAYSKALEGAGGIWDDESLYKFLHKPSKFISGTKMSFAGISKPEDIANVIAFLKEKAS